MSVHIYQPRKQQGIRKIQHLPRGTLDSITDGDDSISADRYSARTIKPGCRADDAPCMDNQIVGVGISEIHDGSASYQRSFE
jgi:hypothetical protein